MLVLICRSGMPCRKAVYRYVMFTRLDT